MLTYSWFILAFALSGGPANRTSLVAEANSTPQDSVVALGEFVRIDRSHWAQGAATLSRVGDEVVLIFSEAFQAAKGPDLRVLLSPHTEPRSGGELGVFVELGKLESAEGPQRYAVGSGVDLASMKSVVIFCNPYEVVFSTATLKAP